MIQRKSTNTLQERNLEQLYLNHLKKFDYYCGNLAWKEWYAKVAPLKGQRIVKVILDYKDRNSTILDLGCGLGFTTYSVSKIFPKTVGCDIGDKEIEATNRLLEENGTNIPVIKYDGKSLPFPKNHFDAVLFIEVIEHVDNPDLVLKEIKRVLKPNGILHITTANKLWPMEPHFKLLFLSYLPSKLADFYVKMSRKGSSYQGIKLPTYSSFYKMVNKYFSIKDITLDVIKDNKRYNLGEERGFKVILLGKLLRKIGPWKDVSVLKHIKGLIEYFLIRISLGWLFICFPNKKS